MDSFIEITHSNFWQRFSRFADIFKINAFRFDLNCSCLMLDFIEENNQIPGMNGGKDRSNQCSDMISAALIGKDVPVKCHSDLAPLFKF